MERKFFPNIIGNSRIKETVAPDILNGKAAHAYIIEGPKGSGRYKTALAICASVVCENRGTALALPCGECDSCKKILGGLSVDVLLTEKASNRQSIGVEQIRPIKNSLYIAPNDGAKKFYIIKDADFLTQEAQNALLLPIEEPPEFVMFILICENAASLLETVRSRAPILRTERFSPLFTEEYLRKKYGPSNRDKLSYASHLAFGSLGRAEELYEHGADEAKLYKCASDFLDLLLNGKSSESVTFIRNSMPSERTDVCEVLSLMRFALRDIIAVKKGGEPIFYTDIPAYAKKISVKRALHLYSIISQAEDDIAANCSVNTVLAAVVGGYTSAI